MKKISEKIKKYLNWNYFPYALIIFFILLVIICNLVGNTLAVVLDREKSSKNVFEAGTLDLSISAEADFSPKVVPEQAAERKIKVKNEGKSTFDYELEIINASDPDDELCGNLKLGADWQDDGNDEYNGDLRDFIFNIDNYSGEDQWKFKAELKDTSASWSDKKCEFDIIARGKQRNNLSQGFSDYEIIHNVIESDVWTEELRVFSAQAGTTDEAGGAGVAGTENLTGAGEVLDVGDNSPENPPSEPIITPENPENTEQLDGEAQTPTE